MRVRVRMRAVLRGGVILVRRTLGIIIINCAFICPAWRIRSEFTSFYTRKAQWSAAAVESKVYDGESCVAYSSWLINRPPVIC
jgi:hypothetical protein